MNRILQCGLLIGLMIPSLAVADDEVDGAEYFERRVRPLLIKHCYECHSEEAGEQQGGLLLDRASGWLDGGDSGKAVLPGEPDASLLVKAVRYSSDSLQMPPDEPLDATDIRILEEWIQMGAPGPVKDLGETEFSRLGDQNYLFDKAKQHWAFQAISDPQPPAVSNPVWSRQPIDRFVFDQLKRNDLYPSAIASPRDLFRRLNFDLTGLPPTFQQVAAFKKQFALDPQTAVESAIDRMVNSPTFGQHFGRLWLDVARYADTDSAYRPDTRSPYYFPFAFTYRDYVIRSFNEDKPIDRFIQEQLAADLMDLPNGSRDLAALGFLAAGPHVQRNPEEALDDWIDITTRGLMGITVACARCHDHKYEPVPTADYYSLRGVFSSISRTSPLDEKRQPLIPGYEPSEAELADYQQKRAEIDQAIEDASGKKTRNNNRPIAQKIRDTQLAELLTFHPAAPARAMIVKDNKTPEEPFIFVRGDKRNRGEKVPRRFLQLLDPQQTQFPEDQSGRLQVAQHITSSENPLTARVFVNRIWGHLIGSHLVETQSDFGLQGSPPTHPELLDWLARDFMRHNWSLKHLVRQIVSTRTYQQRSHFDNQKASVDPTNQQLWRANRKRLSIEALRDSMLAVAGRLNLKTDGRAERLWEKESYTKRRAVYGFINRFNLDPTLRAFDFPAPMQTQPARTESIVAPQALFTLNSPIVIDQADAIVALREFSDCEDDRQRAAMIVQTVFQREAFDAEVSRILKFVQLEKRFENAPKNRQTYQTTWSLIAQAMLMSNEFQYVD